MPDISISDLPLDERSRTEILSPGALAFLAELHGRFDARRLELLGARRERRAVIAAGGKLDFRPETREIREDCSWQAAPPRGDYADRRVEIIGPTDRKLVIDALNSGAKGFMADLEDANSPTWRNQVSGQANLIDAIEGTITYDGSDGRHLELVDDPATLMVRLRGWHLPERHLDSVARPAPAPWSTSASSPSTVQPAWPPGGAAPTSTCRRWSTTWRPASGTRSSPSPRTVSASTAASSAPRS
jgi:malate synthase